MLLSKSYLHMLSGMLIIDQYNAKFISNFLRHYFLAVLRRAIKCQFSIAFDFLRPDLAAELNEARHKGRHPQHKLPRLLCLDQRVLIYNSEDENSGEETQAALSKVLTSVTDLILAIVPSNKNKANGLVRNMLSFPHPTCNTHNYVNAKKSKMKLCREKKPNKIQNQFKIQFNQIVYMSQLSHRTNASEMLEDHRRDSNRNECKKRKISVVQYSGLLLKSKHKPFAASAMRGTDTAPVKDAVHSQGPSSTKGSADHIPTCFCVRVWYIFNLLAIFSVSIHKGHFNIREREKLSEVIWITFNSDYYFHYSYGWKVLLFVSQLIF